MDKLRGLLRDLILMESVLAEFANKPRYPYLRGADMIYAVSVQSICKMIAEQWNNSLPPQKSKGYQINKTEIEEMEDRIHFIMININNYVDKVGCNE